MPKCPIAARPIQIPADDANGNFRDPGPEREAILDRILIAMGEGLTCQMLQDRFRTGSAVERPCATQVM
jgi:hypothetical protein